MFDVKFDHHEPTAENIQTFWFKPTQPVRYTAGQFIELYLPHDKPDARGIKRWFTLSSSPNDELTSITTKITPDCSSFKKTLASLEPGTKLKMASPMGDFVLPKDDSIPLLFVAGGIGCTPFHSIIKYLKDTGQKRDIRMIYAANTLEEVAFKSLFESLDKFEIILSDPPKDWQGKSGRIGAGVIQQASEDSKRHIYLSGPEPMVEKLIEELKSLGVDEKSIHGDYFPGYQPI